VSEGIPRVRFHSHQHLGAADLSAEQAYHRDMRRRHNLAHHTWGAVVGLDLRLEEDARLLIAPGMAVDGFGREIVVLSPTELGPDAFLAEGLRTGMHPVWVAYHQEDAVPAAYGYAECAETGTLRRVVEGYRLHVGEPADPDGRDDVEVAGDPLDTPASTPFQGLPREEVKARWYVLLGEVFWDAGARTFTQVDLARRPWVGAVAQAVWAPAGDLRLVDRREAADLQVSVEGRLEVDDLHTAKGDIELHGTRLVALNDGGGGGPVALGRSEPGGGGGIDLYLEIGRDAAAGRANRLLVRSEGGERLTVAQDGTTHIHGATTVRGGKELRLDGGQLGIARQGGSTPQWIVRQPDPGAGSQLQLRETIGEADGDERVVLEVLPTAGNDHDPVLRLNADAGATLSPAQVKALTHGGQTALHRHQIAMASHTEPGTVQIAQSGSSAGQASSGAPLVVRADDARLLTAPQRSGLTSGTITSLHRHTTTFINETRHENLYADEGTTDMVTVTLSGQRRVLATAALVGTERGAGAVRRHLHGDACIDVYMIDGAPRPYWYSGGAHFGSPHSTANLRRPSYRGLATTITFRLRSFLGRSWGIGIVYYEMP
jgi:hypothetical protein